MKKNLFTLLCIGILSCNVSAQESTNNTTASATVKTTSHKVSLGETMVMIARKYMITPSDIYRENPQAVEGISPGMVLTIPLEKAIAIQEIKKQSHIIKKEKEDYQQNQADVATVKSNPVTASSFKNENVSVKSEVKKTVPEPTPLKIESPEITEHNVKSGETLTGLARKYNTSIKEIKKANPKKLKYGLQIGQQLTIPENTKPKAPAGAIIHDVKPGETLFGLARKYNTTVAEIKRLNSRKLKRGLQIGQKINIMPLQSQSKLSTAPPVGELKPSQVKIVNGSIVDEKNTAPPKLITHTIGDGETLQGLADKYNTSVAAITELNKRKLVDGMQEGLELSILTNTN